MFEVYLFIDYIYIYISHFKLINHIFENEITHKLWLGMHHIDKITKHIEKRLDGNYTRMVHAVLNRSWKQHPTYQKLYGHLLFISLTIQVRWTKHAGHCWRSKDQLMSGILLWTPTHRCVRVGWPAKTCIHQYCVDTRHSLEDLLGWMDKDGWWERVRPLQAVNTTWWDIYFSPWARRESSLIITLLGETKLQNQNLENKAPASNLDWLVGILSQEKSKQGYSEIKPAVYIIICCLALLVIGLYCYVDKESGINVVPAYVTIIQPYQISLLLYHHMHFLMFFTSCELVLN